jgi:tetratricopeptide (TPR) repeat protein
MMQQRNFRRAGRIFVAIVVLGVFPTLGHAQSQYNVVHPLPQIAPPWVSGYKVRWPVRVLGETFPAESLSVVVRIPTGGWLRPDASDVAVQTARGELLPLAVLSHDDDGETIVQFKRSRNEAWYWIYGAGPPAAAPQVDPKADAAFHEGMTLEVREWAGDDLASWAAARTGLETSANLLGNAVVTSVVQSGHPARPDAPQKFVASYRGWLNVTKEGAHSFLANCEGAAFLFIDGFKVIERPGHNQLLAGTVKLTEIEALTAKVDLTPGRHFFELHHIVGDVPDTAGRLTLSWQPPEQPKLGFVNHAALARPLYARVAAVEAAPGERAVAFTHGIEDVLFGEACQVMLVRFEASGDIDDPAKLVWDFGDGTSDTGRSVVHAYFQAGDYVVSLAGGSLPAFKQRIRVWPEPVETSPFSLSAAVAALARLDVAKLNPDHARAMFTFLTTCQQVDRWPLIDKVAAHLLALPETREDREYRSRLHVAQLEALAHTGRAAEALKLANEYAAEYEKIPALAVRLQLAVAAIHQYQLKNAAEASKIYKQIIDKHGRTEHPNLRLAGLRWGDLYAEQGDFVRAGETYRIAATLGGEELTGSTVTDASTRGALLRVAEQKLRSGSLRETRQILQRLEIEYPGRRLDGFYCFLHAESDRLSGQYEDALRHYEMIFKLPQWAGYRDRATFGIGDCHLRQGQLEEALAWFAKLKQAFPESYETLKVATVEQQARERLERAKAAAVSGSAEQAALQEYRVGFEASDPAWFGTSSAAFVRAPSIAGQEVMLLDAYPRDTHTFDWRRPLTNLVVGQRYWVELWYRDVVWPPPPPAENDLHVISQFVFTEDNMPKNGEGMQMHAQRGIPHQWHRMAFQFKATKVESDLQMSLLGIRGVLLIDDIRIRPVSDAQLDALTSFAEGKASP